MKLSMKTLLACGASSLCLSLGAANAQSVDYNMLQQTFGEPVTMSATGKPQRASDVPADMIIITQDQIRRSGATKLIDLLKFVPGLDVATIGDSVADVNVHGFLQPAAPRLLVLVNGRQVYLDHYGYVSWNTIPVQLSEIQQIEIVKGPGSSLFGFNAVAGVINIITIDPQTTQKSVLTATGGSYGARDFSAVLSHRLSDTVAAKFSGGYSAQDAYAISPTIGKPINPEALNASLNVAWQADSNVVVRGETTWARSQQFEQIAVGGFSNAKYLTYSYKLGASADTSLGLFDVSAYRNHMTYITAMPYVGALNDRNDVTVVSANDLFKASNDVTIRLATEYRNNINTADGITPKDGAEVVSGSAMVDWTILPQLSWTNSGRIDAFALRNTPFDRNMTVYSWNSGLVWRASPTDTVRLLAGRSIQTPSLILLSLYPGLDPSGMESVELGWDHDFSDISSKLHISVYRQWYDKVLGLMSNRGNTSASGAEVIFKGANQSGWSWTASLNARSVNDALTPSAGPYDISLDYAATTPKYVATFGVGKTWGAFEFNLLGKWQSHSKTWEPYAFMPGFVDLPDFLTMTARVGWKISDHFTLAVTAAQFNKQTIYEQSGVPDKSRYMITLTSSL